MSKQNNQVSKQPSLMFCVKESLNMTEQQRTSFITQSLEGRSSDEVSNLIIALVNVAIDYTSACDEAVWLHLATNNMHPHDIGKLNLPSLAAAIKGYSLAKGIDKSKLCDTCAFKRGTLGNCSESTQDDLEHAINTADVFYCHDDSDGQTRHINKACQGWVQFKRNLAVEVMK